MNQNRLNIDNLVINHHIDYYKLWRDIMRQPNAIDHIIAQNMRDIRQAKRMSLNDVASKIGVCYQQLRKYETCTNRISAGKLWELSIIYKTPVQKFYKDTD